MDTKKYLKLPAADRLKSVQADLAEVEMAIAKADIELGKLLDKHASLRNAEYRAQREVLRLRTGKTTAREAIMAFLSEHPTQAFSAIEIAEELGLVENTARNTLAMMSSASREFPQQVYIAYFDRIAEGRKLHTKPFYMLGAKAHAEPIAPLTATEKTNRYRVSVRKRMAAIRPFLPTV